MQNNLPLMLRAQPVIQTLICHNATGRAVRCHWQGCLHKKNMAS